MTRQRERKKSETEEKSVRERRVTPQITFILDDSEAHKLRPKSTFSISAGSGESFRQ